AGGAPGRPGDRAFGSDGPRRGPGSRPPAGPPARRLPRPRAALPPPGRGRPRGRRRAVGSGGGRRPVLPLYWEAVAAEDRPGGARPLLPPPRRVPATPTRVRRAHRGRAAPRPGRRGDRRGARRRGGAPRAARNRPGLALSVGLRGVRP